MCWAIIDGCAIPIAAPVSNRTDYYNCKGFYSILLQCVVDADYYFLDVFMGVWEHLGHNVYTSMQNGSKLEI